MTTEYTPPRAATLHLGGDAWAHPDLAPLVRDLYRSDASEEPAIRRHPDNPRRGDHEAIVDSIRVNGVYSPIKVQTSTGYVLAGNHTLDAITDQGGTHAPLVWLDVDDDEARRIMLADNRTAELGGYDQQLLLDQIRAAQTADALLAGTGYTTDDLAELERAMAAAERQALNDPDDAPPAPPDDYVPISQPGDVWQLGRHRLVCGDSTLAATFDALLGDDLAAGIWTDPPYGVEYEGKTSKAMTIQNDGAEGLHALLDAALGQAVSHTSPGGAVYVSAPAGPVSLAFAEVLTDLKVWRQTLSWVKDVFVLGHSDYHYKHEHIYFGYVPGAEGRRGRGGEGWYGDNSQTSVLDFPRPKQSREHPTMKPVPLVAYCIRNSTRPGDLVLDPFGGSGTTLIACETEDRTARLIELDPKYADVICRRYQQHTGTIPVRDGEPVDFC